MRSVLRKTLGILCLVIGLFCLVTPLTPGAWLIFVGLELLGLGFLIPKKLRELWNRWAEKFLQSFRKKSAVAVPKGHKDAAQATTDGQNQ